MATAALQLPSSADAPSSVVVQISAGPPASVRLPLRALTHAGFRAWVVSDEFPDRGRISYLNGEVWIDMSPEPYETHGQVKNEINRVLLTLNRKHKLGAFFPDRTLLTNEAVGLSTEPDAAFALWETLWSGRLALVPGAERPDCAKEIQGAPDWVLEIVSDSSAAKDLHRLRDLYFRAGIPEYWLIDARGDDLAFTILVAGRDGYADAPGRGQWQASPVFQRRFRLHRERGPLGIWEYTLHQRRS